MDNIFEYDVFLSFAVTDEDAVRPLWQTLCMSGLRVFWSDATLKGKLGESWFEAIQVSLERSRHLLLICTPASMSSSWVKREYVAFYNHCYQPKIRRLIPVWAEGYRPSDLPLFLRELEGCQLNARDAMGEIVRLLGGDNIEELKRKLESREDDNRRLTETVDVLNSEIVMLRAQISAQIENTPVSTSAAAEKPLPDEAARADVRVLVDKHLQLAVVKSTGQSMDVPNLHAAWRKLHEVLAGKELMPLCDILEGVQDFQTYWKALRFLHFSCQDVEDVNALSRVVTVVCDHVPQGGHLQGASLELIQSLTVILPKQAIWKALLSALRMTSPSASLPIVKAIVLITPTTGIGITSRAILRLFGGLDSTSSEGVFFVDAVELLGDRSSAESLGDIMMRTVPQAAAKIAALLARWQGAEASTALRKYVDANHQTVSQLYFIETLRALYRAEGPSSCSYIARILPHCHPYVQRYLPDHLRELRDELEIIAAVKRIYSTTNDPDVKKGLEPMAKNAQG
jgi:hypothetical protein